MIEIKGPNLSGSRFKIINRMQNFFTDSSLSTLALGRAFSTFIADDTMTICTTGLNTHGQTSIAPRSQLEIDGGTLLPTPIVDPTSGLLVDVIDYRDWGVLGQENDYMMVRNMPIHQVVAGTKHAVFLTADGNVFTTGSNKQFQLGFKEPEKEDNVHNNFSSLGGDFYQRVEQVWAGGYFTWLRDINGRMWVSGANESGQCSLQHGGSKISEFTRAPLLDSAEKISLGYYHSAFIDGSGDLWAFGYNRYGQCGSFFPPGKNIFNYDPAIVDADVQHLACGGAHTIYSKNDGTVWALGHNQYGQLGHTASANFGTHDFNDVPTQITALPGYSPGVPAVVDPTTGAITTPAIPATNEVKQIVCGTSHTIILYTSGDVWAFGYNKHGQLGPLSDTVIVGEVVPSLLSPTKIASDIIEIQTGATHTIMIKDFGGVQTYFAMGDNRCSQLFIDGLAEQTVTPTSIDCDGENIFPVQLRWTPPLTNVSITSSPIQLTLEITDSNGNVYLSTGDASTPYLDYMTATNNNHPIVFDVAPYSSNMQFLESNYSFTLFVQDHSVANVDITASVPSMPALGGASQTTNII